MLKGRVLWCVFSAIIMCGCVPVAEKGITTSAPGYLFGNQVTLCEVKASLPNFLGEKFKVSGFLFGGPHGVMLVESFALDCGIPLDISESVGSSAEVSHAMISANFAWADKNTPWAYVTVIGTLKRSGDEQLLSFRVLDFASIRYWRSVNWEGDVQ